MREAYFYRKMQQGRTFKENEKYSLNRARCRLIYTRRINRG